MKTPANLGRYGRLEHTLVEDPAVATDYRRIDADVSVFNVGQRYVVSIAFVQIGYLMASRHGFVQPRFIVKGRFVVDSVKEAPDFDVPRASVSLLIDRCDSKTATYLYGGTFPVNVYTKIDGEANTLVIPIRNQKRHWYLPNFPKWPKMTSALKASTLAGVVLGLPLSTPFDAPILNGCLFSLFSFNIGMNNLE